MGASLTKNYEIEENNEYEGEIFSYLASETISKGQPVCYGFDVNGNKVMKLIHNQAEDDHYLGICLEDVQPYYYGKVLTRGIGYIKRITQYTSNTPTTILLNNLTHNTNNIDKYINFRDNGNLAANYETQQRKIRFDAGSGNTWILTLKAAEFEHTTYSLYDRLLLWVGDDGEVWSKANITGWQSTSSTSEYGSSSKGGSSTPKNIVPNYSSGTPQVININSRWLRFNFYADTSTHYDGWDIELKTSDWSPSSNPIDVPVNTPLYIDASDNNATETPQTSWSMTKILGRVVIPTASNDRVKIRINY
jgi:hypothetical protein